MKRAMEDATRLANDLKSEQESALKQEVGRKSAEAMIKELQVLIFPLFPSNISHFILFYSIRLLFCII